MTAAYYYKVRWGFQAEFERLFFKNHYPVLKEQMGAGGRIKSVGVYRPTLPRRGPRRLDVPGGDHVLELGRARRPEPGRGDREAPLPGPGDVQEGGGAALRDPRRALGRAARRGRAAAGEPSAQTGGSGATALAPLHGRRPAARSRAPRAGRRAPADRRARAPIRRLLLGRPARSWPSAISSSVQRTSVGAALGRHLGSP